MDFTFGGLFPEVHFGWLFSSCCARVLPTSSNFINCPSLVTSPKFVVLAVAGQLCHRLAEPEPVLLPLLPEFIVPALLVLLLVCPLASVLLEELLPGFAAPVDELLFWPAPEVDLARAGTVSVARARVSSLTRARHVRRRTAIRRTGARGHAAAGGAAICVDQHALVGLGGHTFVCRGAFVVTGASGHTACAGSIALAGRAGLS